MTIKKLLLSLTATLLITVTSGCGESNPPSVTESLYENTATAEKSLPNTNIEVTPSYQSMYQGSLPQFRLPESGDTVVTLITNYGNIHLLMFPEAAPKAVENFVTHGKDDYYDGLIFHRVIQDFMIQGGDPKGVGSGGESIWGESFEDECLVNYFPVRGALAMANSGPNTNGSQFFIVQSDNYDERYDDPMIDFGFDPEMIAAHKALGGTPHLFNQHTVFGQVVQGMDVVDAIAAVEVNSSNDKPIKDVVIKDVLITTID